MKINITKRSMFSVFMASLLLMAAPLFAEKGKKGKGGWMMKHMKEELDLTDAQAEKMKALHEKNGELNKALRDKVGADVANLKVLVNNKAKDSELSALITTLKADRKAMQDAEQKNLDAMQEILTPMQQAKAALKMADKMGGAMRGMRGHGDDGDDGDAREHEGKEMDGDDKDKKRD